MLRFVFPSILIKKLYNCEVIWIESKEGLMLVSIRVTPTYAI